MNNITILSAVLSLIFTISNNTANAGFFDWINQTDETENNVAINSENWDFNKAFRSFQNIIVGRNITDVPGLPAQADTNEEKINPYVNPEPKKELRLIAEHTVTATAYSSTPDQTDDTPFTTASGTTVRDGIIAANFLPFGTLVRIPEIFGDKIFVVEDRMNRRYATRIDIWFPERELAKIFGIKKVSIEVVAMAPQN